MFLYCFKFCEEMEKNFKDTHFEYLKVIFMTSDEMNERSFVFIKKIILKEAVLVFNVLFLNVCRLF